MITGKIVKIHQKKPLRWSRKALRLSPYTISGGSAKLVRISDLSPEEYHRRCVMGMRRSPGGIYVEAGTGDEYSIDGKGRKTLVERGPEGGLPNLMG